ncbi:hypothetical protein PspLS_11256 [Pyricularia sp. CBS 133598]|nr:hypothetical protein PspLS_11256 [Pyricularia sp. CBS 133598]
MHAQFFSILVAASAAVAGPLPASELTARQAAAAPAPVPLRIMAAGASVTFGVGSSTGNSYRKDLLDLLQGPDGTFTKPDQVSFVGAKKNGDFDQNAVEATSGFVIKQIAGAMAKDVPQLKPNLVLIDAGTNNCNKGGVVADAGTQVDAMLRKVFADSPGVTVVMTNVLVNKIAKQEACRVDENKQFDAVWQKLKDEGAKLVTVDMRSPAGPTTDDLFDTRHPNDAGYVKMANVFFGGIQEAASKGFLTAPAA